jgi:RimJ/RimL family protein N-acetyltransferase
VSSGVRRVESKHEAAAALDDRFLRWQVTPAGFQEAWLADGAVVVHRIREGRPQLIALGEPAELGHLLDAAAAELPASQLSDGEVRLTVESRAVGWIGPALRLDEERASRWEWMWTVEQPPPVPGEEEVRWVDDIEQVSALLRDEYPEAHGRPGDPDIRGWAGRFVAGNLVATGALADLDTGVAHLRSITTAVAARGRGHGAAVSAFLTRAGLASHPPAVTLGLYSDNAVARRLYARLGYRPSHALVSGPVLPA